MLETLPPPTEKIRSKLSIRVQSWVSGLLVLPTMLAGMLSLMGFMTLGMNKLWPEYDTSVPEGRQAVLELSLWTAPFIIIGPMCFILLLKSWRLMDEYHRTLIVGTVVELKPTEHRGYAIVRGENRAGGTITDKVSVPLAKWPTLQLGDSYPFQ